MVGRYHGTTEGKLRTLPTRGCAIARWRSWLFIGHLKAEHRMDRNISRDATAIAAMLACLPQPANNFGLFLRWPARLLSAPIKTLFAAPSRAQIA